MLYNVIVEIGRTLDFDDDDWDDWMDALATYAVAVGSTRHGTMTVHMCVLGGSVGQAAFTACALTKTVTGLEPYGLEILPQGEWERREEIPVSV
jgi:hypothetical protein